MRQAEIGRCESIESPRSSSLPHPDDPATRHEFIEKTSSNEISYKRNHLIQDRMPLSITARFHTLAHFRRHSYDRARVCALHSLHGPPPSRRHHQSGQTCVTSAPPPMPILFSSIRCQQSTSSPLPKRTATRFAANATLKAVYYSRFAPGQLVLADDSGLEVDALGGAPGVRSARFAADSGLVDSPDANDNTDVWNNMVLLQRLATIPASQRTARYRCVLVAARDGVVASRRRKAQWRARSLKRRAAPADLATIRSSTCRSWARPWRNSTLIRSSRSAIADARSRLCCPCCFRDVPHLSSTGTSPGVVDGRDAGHE